MMHCAISVHNRFLWIFSSLFLLIFIVSIDFCRGDDNQELTLVPQIQKGQQQSSAQGAGGETLYDIYGVVQTSEPFPFLAVGIALLVILIALVLAYLYNKKKKARPLPTVPPWDLALNELAAAKPLRSVKTALTYMERTGQILRTYIEGRFAIQSTRQTTREFLCSSELENHDQLLHFRLELQTCLEQADMAKFAHRIPRDEQLLAMEDAVTAFVMKTKPAPVDTNSGKKSEQTGGEQP